MLETSARLLRLLTLFQGRRYWSGADLADRLEVTSRTVRRDVDKLRSLGYPIHSTSGLEGGYQLGAGATMPPLLLDDDEAVAAVIGLRFAAIGGVIEGVEEASLRALTKIEQLLPARLGRQVAALQSVIVAPCTRTPAVPARTLSTIAAACRDTERLQFRYRDQAGAATARVVEPHRLVNVNQRWYLVAWDITRKAWRTFRLDRIERRLSTGPRFVQRDPPSNDLAAYVTGGGRLSGLCRARIKLFASAEVMAGRVPPSVGAIEPIDSASCFFDVGASSYEVLAMHLTLLGVDFEVEEPFALVDEIRKIADRYQRATRSETCRGTGVAKLR